MPNTNYTFDIIGGNEEAEYTEFSPQRLVNMFMVSHPEAIVKKAAFPTPGLSIDEGILFDVGGATAEGRLAYLFKEIAYVVIKDTLFGVKASAAPTGNVLIHYPIGQLNTQSGYIGAASLGNQLMLVDGVDGWILDVSTNTLTQIGDSDFPTEASDVVVLGNRFVTNKGGTNLFYYSDSGDGLTWGALNFFSASDTIVAFSTINGRMLIMSTTATEPWYVAGGLAPFLPQLPSFDYGCAAPGSVAKGYGMVVWLSRTDKGVSSVVATTGGMPQPISNESIDTAFDKYTDVSDASAYLYKNEIGHLMYVINFTIANSSWMYDFNTRKWSELSSEEDNRHLGNVYVYLSGRHYVLDYQEPKMYDMSIQFGDDAGAPIKRLTTSPHFVFPDKTVIDEFRVIMKQGTGASPGNITDENPKIRLRVSWDGGHSYGAEIDQPIGEIGQRLTDTFFDKLGLCDSWVFELTHYNRTPYVVLGAVGNVGAAK